MREYEVVIIGAGPAGGQCARQLTAAGHKVLLVDRVSDFAQNNFSSAGAPLEVLNDFQIPPDTVGAFWNNLHCSSKNFSHTWRSPHPQGIVFDFKKLRQFLANEIIKTGRGELLLGYAFKELTARNGGSEVTLENVATKEPVTVKAQVVVDATGPARAVIYAPAEKKPNYYTATGLEYLLQLDEKTAQRLGPNTLHFFVGPYFVPRGYGWVFPMNDRTFKVGVGSWGYPHPAQDQPLKFYLEKLVKDFLRLSNYQILDRHGGTLKASFGHRDRFYQENILAIGDAVSAVNWLGAEGVRHALHGADLAAAAIDDYLSGRSNSFVSYPKKMRRYFGHRWLLSQLLALLVYKKFSDRQMERLFRLVSYLNIEEFIQILFHYDFHLGFVAAARATKAKLRKLFTPNKKTSD